MEATVAMHTVASKRTEESRILVRGGNPLNGSVEILGAKNSVLKLMAACILVPDEIILNNVPNLNDVQQMISIIKFLGGKCKYSKRSKQLKLNLKDLSSSYAPFDLVGKLRASFVILGPLLARLGTARVSLPGGCQIGSRRVDLHEKGLKQLGAEMEVSHGYVEAEVPKGRLIGAEIHLDVPSNGATENLMMAAVLAKGKTIIQNAAKDPEIEDLANFLNACGAKITGAGSQCIEIDGVELNELHGAEYDCMPDRIEAGTFMIAALATGGNVTVENVNPKHLTALLSKLKETGAEIHTYSDAIQISAPERLNPVEVSSMWYPGFPTDLQPQLTALLTKANGTSIIKEAIYEDRFSHVQELMRMGADIQLSNNVAVIKGVKNLSGAIVTGSDLRATAGLIIAGLFADGVSEVYGLNHLDRGYDGFAEKLASLGAEINRVDVE